MINELEQKFKDIQSFVKTSFEELEPLKDSITYSMIMEKA